MLPLTLLGLERGAVMAPPRQRDTHGNWFAFAHTVWPATHHELPRVSAGRVQPMSEDARRAVAGAFADEVLAPNAQWEVRQFELDAVPGQPVSVHGLDLEALEGALTEAPVDVRVVLRALWSTFTSGGAYGAGRCLSWGRLLAWDALAAMCGLTVWSGLERIAEEAAQAAFTTFTSTSDWFEHVGVDIGLACLRGDGRSLVVLVATDSD